MAVTPKRMSLAEFLELPEVKPALELRHGMVSQKMAPSGPHSSIQGWFVSRIDWFAEPRELAQTFPGARLLLGEQTYVPDVVVYRWERVPSDERGELPRYFTTPPDLVIEILSPGQTETVLLERARELVAHSVGVVVCVNPARRKVHLIRADREVGPLGEGDVIDFVDVLPGFELTVSDLFARVRARPPRRAG